MGFTYRIDLRERELLRLALRTDKLVRGFVLPFQPLETGTGFPARMVPFLMVTGRQRLSLLACVLVA